jgi:tetratricopeptide (TPR) repeat protein
LSALRRIVLLIGSLTLATDATADYKVTAYQATPGYKALMAADYETAARAAPVPGSSVNRFAITSNRCVAEVQLGNLDAALRTCNSALGEYSAYQSFSYLPGNRRQEKASLLSNRGVVLALQGQIAEAEDDFVQALKYAPEHANAQANLELLRARMVGQR